MKRSLKIAAIALATLLAAVAALAISAELLSARKGSRIIAVDVKPIALADDSAGLARGKYLFNTLGCIECHGANGGGAVVINDPSGFYVKAPNITPGAGSAVAKYATADWVKILRHGVKPQGTPAFVMPSEEYSRLTDADLGALIAYTRALPPVAGEGAAIRLPLLVKGLYAFGEIRDAAEKIDHSAPPPVPVATAATVAHGAYLAASCSGCHAPNFGGGRIPGTPPSWPAAANLTPAPGSALQRYADVDQFKAMLRTGKRPDGSAVSTVMPFNSLKNYSDVDVEALYLYLKSLPPVAAAK